MRPKKTVMMVNYVDLKTKKSKDKEHHKTREDYLDLEPIHLVRIKAHCE